MRRYKSYDRAGQSQPTSYDNTIKPEDTRALIEALKSNREITELVLTRHGIGPEGVKVLSEALKSKQGVVRLVLAYNQIGSEGAKTLAKVLINNQSIKYLNLGNNQLFSEGIWVLAEVLKSDRSIIELGLSNNQFGPKGAKALAGALENNQNITVLNLDGNEIGSEGVKELAEGLKINQGITELILDNNEMGPEGAKALAGVLERNQRITKLSLYRNKIGFEGEKALTDALKTNHTIIELKFDNETPDHEITKNIERNKSIQKSLDEISQAIHQGLTDTKSLEVASIEEKLTAYQNQFPNSSIIRLLIAKLNMLKLVSTDNSDEQFKFFKLVMQDIGSSKNMPIALVSEMSDLLEQIMLRLAQVKKNVTAIVDLITGNLAHDHPLYLNGQAAIVNILFGSLDELYESSAKQKNLAQCYAIFKNVQQQSPELLKIPETSLFASLMKTFDKTVETVQLNQTMESLKKDHADAFSKATNLVNKLLWPLNPLAVIISLSHLVVTLPDSTKLSPTENKVCLAPFKDNKNIYQMLYRSNNEWRSDRVICFQDGKLSMHSTEDAAQDNYAWNKPLSEKIEHYFPETAQYSVSNFSTTPFWNKPEKITQDENISTKKSKNFNF